MLPVPRLPTKVNDELIGGFLTRICVDNALDSKHVLLKWLGFSRSERNNQFMDIAIVTPTWLELADKLEITHRDLITEMSTKPYWASFYVQAGDGPECLKRELQDVGVPVDALLSRSRVRSQLQICTTCLRHDCNRAPWVPILRRSHQLLGTSVCHVHRAPLISRCPKCDVVLIAASRLALTSPYCHSCGFDLRKFEPRLITKLNPIYKLALFEHQCLVSSALQRPINQAQTLIRRTCEERELSLAALTALARNRLGEVITNWVSSRVAQAETPTVQLKSAPSICGLLVTLGFDQETVRPALDRCEPVQAVIYKPPPQPEDVISARTALLDEIRTNGSMAWNILRRKSRYIYWLLVLEDRPWLEEQLGPSRSGTQVPSINEDRVTILSPRPRGVQIEAKTRAYYRDRSWLDETLSALVEERAAKATVDLVARVTTAKLLWFAKPGRPLKFTTRNAAAAAGMSLAGLHFFSKRARLPGDALWESTRHYRLRLLLWALPSFDARSISPNKLADAAGLETIPQNRFWAATVIYLFGS